MCLASNLWSYVVSFASLFHNLVPLFSWKAEDKTILSSELQLCFVCEVYSTRYAVANFIFSLD